MWTKCKQFGERLKILTKKFLKLWIMWITYFDLSQARGDELLKINKITDIDYVEVMVRQLRKLRKSEYKYSFHYVITVIHT